MGEPIAEKNGLFEFYKDYTILKEIIANNELLTGQKQIKSKSINN